MKVISINGHLRDNPAEVIEVYPLHGFIVIELQKARVFYNQDGREVFRVERELKSGFRGWLQRFLFRKGII